MSGVGLSPHFAWGQNARFRKAVCSNCSHNVIIRRKDGVVLDTELLTVYPDDPRAQTVGDRITGRRLHAESCDRLKRQAELKAFNREQRIKRTKAATEKARDRVKRK